MSVTAFAPRFAGQGASGSPSKAAAQSEACLDKPRLSMMERAVRALRLGLKRRAAIRALGALDEHLLAYIGIDRSRIEEETDAMLARAEHGAE